MHLSVFEDLKDRLKGSWRAAGNKGCRAGLESVQRDPERTMYEAVKMNPRVQWRSQDPGTGMGKYQEL